MRKEQKRPKPTPRPTRPTKQPTRPTSTTTEWPIDDTTLSTSWQTERSTTERTQTPTSRQPERPTTERTRPTSWTTRSTTEQIDEDCSLSITTVNGKSVCKAKLIFQDTFDSVESNKWRNQIKISLDSEVISVNCNKND